MAQAKVLLVFSGKWREAVTCEPLSAKIPCFYENLESQGGTAKHVNNLGLGENGRYRTNVQDHAGISSLGPDRDAQLAMHPTVKPMAMIADAMRDCSRRNGIVLDAFSGSGTVIIAAEATGRRARATLPDDAAVCWLSTNCRFIRRD